MTKLMTILGLCALAALWSCSLTGQAGSQVVSCYDTGHGIVCTNSSEVGGDDDVDGDGETDELVCGDADSSAESLEDDGADDGTDDDGTDDGTDDDGTDDDTMMTEGDETEDDGEDDGDTDSESAEDDSASEDCSSSDGDDDDDGMADDMDCDCAGGGAEEEPPPPDECTDCTPPE